MSAPRRLLLLRHGRTAWNLEGRAQGQADVELDSTGHAQAAAVAPFLAGLRPVALWSSDLSRARQTAEYLATATGLPVKTDARLREFDVGARQGLTWAEFAERYPEAWGRGARRDNVVPVVGGETVAEVRARMVPALREFLGALSPGDTGIAVTHGAALKAGLTGLLGWPEEAQADLVGVDNCAWAVVEEAPDGSGETGAPQTRPRLLAYNQNPAREDVG